MSYVTDTAEAAHRVASAAMYGGAATSAASGGAMYLGFSPGEWQVIGIIGGLVIGFLGFIANSGINFYFKNQHLKLAQSRAAVLASMQEGE